MKIFIGNLKIDDTLSDVTQSGTATPRYYAGIMENNNSKVLKLIHTDKGVLLIKKLRNEKYF